MPSVAENLEFLNRLSGILRIELSEPPEAISERLANQKATQTATITSLVLEAAVFESDDLRPLTDEELDRVALEEPTVVLRGYGELVSHSAPNGRHFTVRELLRAVEATELATRAQSEWFGGVDVHHVYFEGIHPNDGIWQIHWGS